MADQTTSACGSGPLTPAGFIAKWSRAELSERAASHEHFIDLCHMLGVRTPAEHDHSGQEYAFEKAVSVTGPASAGSQGQLGFADVWWRGRFAWEYKRKDKYKDLGDAYRQLSQYREALENPPLLIVCDITRVQIHTNFTNTRPEVSDVFLKDFDNPETLDILRRIFSAPESFCPAVTRETVTRNVAEHIGTLARLLRARGHEPHPTAHFLMKCMFCLFAEDVDLLPEKLFSRILAKYHQAPEQLTARLTGLFDTMRTGGEFGLDNIPWFNGGLFDESPALPLEHGEIGVLRLAAAQEWSRVEPSIFGTLFERSLDPTQRAQIGAHYTGRDDILLIVEPVLMAPLRRQWSAVRQEVEAQLERRRAGKTPATKKKADSAVAKALQEFLERLSALRILDPACGSGNFLYVAIQELLDLEKEVTTFAGRPDIAIGLIPTVRPTQLHGIEINPYAAELAQVVIWIGYLQWMRDNGYNAPSNPILEPLQTIENRDAILNLSDPAHPAPASWPEADFIIGNPPFLGSKLLRKSGLPDDYVAAMYSAFDLPKSSDLCCYWFEMARLAIEKNPSTRAGLLATQGIRGGDNRTVLERIKKTGDIFMAWSDRDWVLDGAAVHVSMVGFDNGTQTERTIEGQSASRINSDLTCGEDQATAQVLRDNEHIAFMGDTKGGAFDVEWIQARGVLAAPNPNGRSNQDVLRPWINGSDITKRPRGMWIVDFGVETSLHDAAGYESPIALIDRLVKSERKQNRRESYAAKWWIHVEPRPAMREALEGLPRFVVTTRVAKYRVFAWASHPTLPDSATFCFARSDDYFFGVLHSSIHELWARRMGTQLREAESGFRYTPTTCFETFPMPWPPGTEPAAGEATVESGKGTAANGQPPASAPPVPSSTVPGSSQLLAAIAAAAADLNALRERWLNPPEWLSPLAAAVDAEDSFADVPAAARPLIRHSAIMARAAKHPQLRLRTLTNLYNERPTWLRLAHASLDRAVLSSYAALDPAGLWSPAWADLWTDSGAGQPLPVDHPLTAQRAEVDQKVLGNLLRLNRERGA